MTPATSTTNAPSAPPSDRAGSHRVAASVDHAWRPRFGGNDLATPLGVVAALSLASTEDTPARAALEDADGPELAAHLRAIWSGFTRCRPDLAVRVLPLAAPLCTTSATPHRVEEVSTVARAAIDAGILALMAPDHRRQRTDLLGEVLAHLRAGSDTDRAWGQVFTPPDIATLLSTMGPGNAQPGRRLIDVGAGTGALILAAANVLRARGIDPAAMSWAAVERDPLTAACLAVNTCLWGLGPNVLIGCADALAGTWQDRARAERQQGCDIARWAPLMRLIRTTAARP